MKTILSIILLVVITYGITSGQTTDTLNKNSINEVIITGDRMIAPLSVMDLLINAKEYQDYTIKVEGFIIQEFEHSAIYFSKEALEKRMSSQAIWIDSKNSKVEAIHRYNNKLVVVYAKFKYGPCGHRGMFRGELYDIEQINNEER